MKLLIDEQRDVILAHTEPTPLPALVNQEDLVSQNLEDLQNNIEISDGLEEDENPNGITAEALERMHLRQRAPYPISVVFLYLSSTLKLICVLICIYPMIK